MSPDGKAGGGGEPERISVEAPGAGPASTRIWIGSGLLERADELIRSRSGRVFLFAARIQTMSPSAAQMCFWAFAAVMGLSMASIFIVFTGTSIARVFFITAAAFGATSLYGYTTKADLTKMGSFMMMGLIGIVIAGLVNIFIGSSAIQFAISVIGVVVFTGLTAWDTQRLKEMYAETYDRDSVTRMAIYGALQLYLDFINLFTMLLNLLGQRNN